MALGCVVAPDNAAKDRARLKAIAVQLLQELANDPTNADVVQALIDDDAKIRISTGIKRTRTHKVTGAVTEKVYYGGVASYGTKSHRISITLDANGNVGPYVKSHIVHEAIHARDRQAGMDIAGKDNLETEVNAWERTILQQVKDTGTTEEPSHMRLLRSNGTVNRRALRRALSKSTPYQQTASGKAYSTVDEPLDPYAEFSVRALLGP